MVKNGRVLKILLPLLVLALAGCNPFQSAQLDITPNPLIVGIFDTKATIHAHVVTHGIGSVPFDHVQFAVYNANNSQLLSTTEKIDTSGRTTTMDRDYTFPINGAAVALSGTKYIEVRIYDPYGKELAARRLDIVVHALSGLNLQSILGSHGILGPQDVTPTIAPAPTPASAPTVAPISVPSATPAPASSVALDQLSN